MTTDAKALLGGNVTYGIGAIRELPGVIEALGARRVLLICGRRSFEASGAAEVLPALEARSTVERWSDFSPNTDAQDLARGLELVDGSSPDLVLGIGGGSAMDMAKLVAAYVGRNGSALELIREGASIEDRAPRLVLVPTTSGSGSEATHFAVVYIGHEKHSIAGPGMRPDHIILDPALSVSGSQYQRATSGIDAVCQAIESLWATGATDESREYARRALPLLLGSIEPFVAEPTGPCVEAMSLGSHLAGRAIDISKTTAAHALSYGITKRHGVSHGHAVAVTLGPFIEAHATAITTSLSLGVDPQRHAGAMAEVLAQLHAENGPEGRVSFTALLERIGLECRLSAVGSVDDVERVVLASQVNVERLKNNPVALSQDDLVAVLRAAG
jgi:alcohol dehydrogenase